MSFNIYLTLDSFTAAMMSVAAKFSTSFILCVDLDPLIHNNVLLKRLKLILVRIQQDAILFFAHFLDNQDLLGYVFFARS